MKTLLTLLLTASLSLAGDISFKELYGRVQKGERVLVAIESPAVQGFDTMPFGYPKADTRVRVDGGKVVEIAKSVGPGYYEFFLYQGVPSVRPVTICPNGKCPLK